MLRSTLFAACILLSLSCHAQKRAESKMKSTGTTASVIPDSIAAKSSNTTLSCKLTSAELRKRKETVLASLKAKVLERKDLSNGFAYRFTGTDEVLDELNSFIKSERECCDFLTFNLSISGDKKVAWLELTGMEGVKEIIMEELGL